MAMATSDTLGLSGTQLGNTGAVWKPLDQGLYNSSTVRATSPGKCTKFLGFSLLFVTRFSSFFLDFSLACFAC